MFYGTVMVKGGEERDRGMWGRSVGGGEVRGIIGFCCLWVKLFFGYENPVISPCYSFGF